MKTYWKTSSVGAEFIQENPESPKDERVLGAVVVDHGYCFPWAKNANGVTIYLRCRFSEHVDKSRQDVENYLLEKGILQPQTLNADEKTT